MVECSDDGDDHFLYMFSIFKVISVVAVMMIVLEAVYHQRRP